MKRLAPFLLLALVACSTPTPETTRPAVPEAAFPRGLALSSPLLTTNVVNSGGGLKPQSVAPSRAYQNDLNDIESALSGTSPSLLFRADAFFLKPGRANCFGPTLLYKNHPDGGSSGQLPGGDLGLWLETEARISGSVVTLTDEACAAAQLNARLSGISQQGKAALVLVATMAASAPGLPAAGASTDVTASLSALGLGDLRFNAATIAQSSSGSWTYSLDLDTKQSGTWRKVVVSLVHTPSSTGYSGTLSYRSEVVFSGGNCGSGANNQTLSGSMKYLKASSSNLRIQSRTDLSCGFGQNGLDSDGLVDPIKAWSDDFNAFTADFDPSSYAGSYSFVWQAGNADASSRVLNLRLNGPASSETISKDGEAYFGFGPRVQTKADLVADIAGFYCNWAGPAMASFQEYAQRQFVSFDSDKGVFVVPAGGSDIRFAPTQSCLNTSSSFQYDRNLNNLFDESAAELTVSARGTAAATDLDLLQPADMDTDGIVTIEEAIAARGYVAPKAP